MVNFVMLELTHTTFVLINCKGEHLRPETTNGYCDHKTQLYDVTDEPLLSQKTIQFFVTLLFKIFVS